MAAINDLIAQVENPELRARLEQEVTRLNKQKKFGLVFEEHMPECTPLYEMPIRRGSHVALRVQQNIEKVYTVLAINEEKALCFCEADKEQAEYALSDLVAVAQFGEPIYPYLKPLDSVCNAPDSDLWHTLIEADNYHALQLLEYLYAGQVDCIYIDPPYNTGAKDWKYNNDYVDGNDSYRHSKWLSFMQKRLKLAKKLLNPKDSVLIVTIDEKEYLHLGCLLEEIFPEARMQMISSVINPKGNRRDNEFSRCEEYIYFVYMGTASITSNGYDMLRNMSEDETESDNDRSVRLRALLRQASNHGKRTDRPNLFYPLYFYKDTGRFAGCGASLSLNESRHDYAIPDGVVAMWPIGSNGTELTWNLQPETLLRKHQEHFLTFGKWDGSKRVGYYLSEGQEENFRKGLYEVIGQDDDGAYIIQLKSSASKDVRPLTIWNRKSHSASEYGTTLLNGMFNDRRFSFPKSIYAVKDSIRFFVANKPNALIVDFFAGSGTTLHAVNLLNAEDGGQRRCIMVTNNEVSIEEAKRLTAEGHRPGDEAWNDLGIARHVTWPRTVCSIEGHDVNGNLLKGNYIGTDQPMADGCKANPDVLKKIEKEYVVDILKSGSSVIPQRTNAKGEDLQSEESYVMMRKFGLILLRDIMEERDSLVRRSFSDILSPADEDVIREKFRSSPTLPDDDINTSVDQTKRLIAAIRKGLTYPATINGSFQYCDVLDFLNKLADIFEWNIYEKNTLGKEPLRKWYAVVLCQWMEGSGLSYIMRRAIEYRRNHPDNFRVSAYEPPTTYNDNSKEHRNVVFADTLEVIENIILFSISNYFLRFSNEFKRVHNVSEFSNNWYEFVEFGTTNPLTILLQRNGFSREAATYIRGHQEYVSADKSSGQLRLNRSLLQCGNTSVEMEAADIILNVPELFV